jgi:hypothetical protein
MDFVASEGIVDEWQIGYQSYGGVSPNCTFPDSPSLRGNVGRIGGPRATIEGYAIMPTNDYKATMNALQMGPLVVAVACSNWHLYSGGVFTDYDKSPRAFDINHAVVLTGYGTDEETGKDYWLIRNSWGPRWYVSYCDKDFQCKYKSHFAFSTGAKAATFDSSVLTRKLWTTQILSAGWMSSRTMERRAVRMKTEIRLLLLLSRCAAPTEFSLIPCYLLGVT